MHRVASILLAVLLFSCGGDEYGGLYDTCAQPEDCADRLPSDVEAECVDKEGEGFCTWSCSVDENCNDDHDDNFDYLCASFEDAAEMYCFPDCNEEVEDEANVCPPDYECRSTGGGVNNRRVCFPN